MKIINYNMNRPIILIGFPTSGKTTLGKKVSDIYNLKFIDLDDYFTNLKGITPEKFILENGFSLYRDEEYIILKNILEKDYDIISTGSGIIENENSRKLLIDQNNVVFLNKKYDLLEKCIYKRFPNLYNESFENLYQRRIYYYRLCADFILDTSKFNINESTKILVNFFFF